MKDSLLKNELKNIERNERLKKTSHPPKPNFYNQKRHVLGIDQNEFKEYLAERRLRYS